jgi:SsrA-binding protein
VQGQALVALRLYWKNGHVKVELGVGKGKSSIDKRHDLKEKVIKRETDRTMAAFNRRHER